MFQIDDPSAALTKPDRPAPGVPGWFQPGDPGVPRRGTRVRYYFLNSLMDELLSVVRSVGIVPSPTDDTQLLAAIRQLVALGTGGEATQRLQADTNEAQIRAQNDAAEVTARQAAIQGVYDFGTANYVARYQSSRNVAVQHFTPGDGQDVGCTLNVAGGSQGGTLLAVASANIAATQPGAANLRMYINSTQLFGDRTWTPMTGMLVASLAPNTNNLLEAHYVTESGNGQPWQPVGLNLAFIFVGG